MTIRMNADGSIQDLSGSRGAQARPDGSIVLTGGGSNTPTPEAGEGIEATTQTGFRGGRTSVVTNPDGTMRVNTPMSAQASDYITVNDCLDTANRAGFPIPRHALKDTDVIQDPEGGGTIRIREAIMRGLVKVGTGGVFEVVGGSQSQPQPQQSRQPQQDNNPFKIPTSDSQQRTDQDGQPQEQAEEVAILDQGTEQFFSDTLNAVGPTLMNTLAHSVIAKGNADAFLGDIATRLRLDPVEAKEQIDGAIGKLVSKAQEVASTVGLDPAEWDSFSEWANKARRDASYEAQMAFFDNGRTAPLKALVRDYIASGRSYDEDSVLSADFGPGVRVYRAGDGKLVINIPGEGTMRFADAVAQDRVRVSKKR